MRWSEGDGGDLMRPCYKSRVPLGYLAWIDLALGGGALYTTLDLTHVGFCYIGMAELERAELLVPKIWGIVDLTYGIDGWTEACIMNGIYHLYLLPYQYIIDARLSSQPMHYTTYTPQPSHFIPLHSRLRRAYLLCMTSLIFLRPQASGTAQCSSSVRLAQRRARGGAWVDAMKGNG